MNMSRRAWMQLVSLGGATAALPLLGCGSKDTSSEWPDRAGPKVVVTFAPLYCFAVNVAGDDAIIKNVMSTTGPHDFQPTDVEAKLLRRADLMFMNGLNLDNEPVNAMQRGSGNASLKVVDLGSRIPEDKLFEGKCNRGDGDHAGHDHGKDPHVWLSPDHAIYLVNGIRDELKLIDPSHSAGYDERAAAYCAKLLKLKEDGIALLAGKTDRKLVTFHDSLTYFEDAFKLTVIGVVQQKPGSEPGAEDLGKLIQKCVAHRVRVIAVEPQYTTTTSAKTLLNEIQRDNKVPDAVLVEIDPMETCATDDLTADWYERKMRTNLEALAKALK